MASSQDCRGKKCVKRSQGAEGVSETGSQRAPWETRTPEERPPRPAGAWASSAARMLREGLLSYSGL